MATELHIFTEDSRIPSHEVWQRAIEQLGFPTVLDPSFDLRRDTGFTPTTYRGKAAGFEFCLEPAATVLSAYPHVASKVGDRDKCVTFRWGSDLTECAAALSAAAALVKLSDGVYFYPDDDILYGANEAIEATRRDLSSIPS
jgi:hypothetical protein